MQKKKEEVFDLKLELGFIEIKDIQFSNESKVENGTLFVNADDVKAFVYEDDDVKACVKSVCFDIAKPGESVRITPVKDVIEPRRRVPRRYSQGGHRWFRQDPCPARHGGRHCRPHRWLPGGHHRYDRPRCGVHSVLQAA